MTEADKLAISVLHESGYYVCTTGIVYNKIFGGINTGVEIIPWKKIRSISIVKTGIHMRLWSGGDASEAYITLPQNADRLNVYKYLKSKFWSMCIGDDE